MPAGSSSIPSHRNTSANTSKGWAPSRKKGPSLFPTLRNFPTREIAGLRKLTGRSSVKGRSSELRCSVNNGCQRSEVIRSQTPRKLRNMPIAIPGVYQEVQQVVTANVDNIELDFPDLPAGNILRIRDVSGALAIQTPAPPITVGIILMGAQDGSTVNLIPGAIYSVTATHGYPVNIPVHTRTYFYIDGGTPLYPNLLFDDGRECDCHIQHHRRSNRIHLTRLQNCMAISLSGTSQTLIRARGRRGGTKT